MIFYVEHKKVTSFNGGEVEAGQEKENKKEEIKESYLLSLQIE
jgi:hypothetical protein